jgi:parvulin-like peptidyl-prolyl isomerase
MTTRIKGLWAGALGMVAVSMAIAGRAEVVDQIAATVDKEVILYSDLMREVGAPLQEARLRAGSEEAFKHEAERIVREGLDQAIEFRILYRQALLAGVQLDDKVIDEEVNKQRTAFGSSEAFEAALKAEGLTMREFRERIKKQRMAASLGYHKFQQFQKEVVVSEAEVAEYYAAHREAFTHRGRAYVRQIFLPAQRDTPERAKALAQMAGLKEELAGGASFAELAKAHSQAPGADQGGLIGWQTRGDLVEPLDTNAFSLPVGNLSDVLETANGVHLLLVEKREEPGTRSLSEVRTEIEPLLRRERAQKRFATWMNELRKKSRVRTFL